MARISSAPYLEPLDGLTSFDRAIRQPLLLGLFLPHQQGAWYTHIRDTRDETALAHFFNAFAQGDQSSWRQHSALDWAVGGNLHLVGTPEMVVEWFVRLHAAGVDGVQVNFFDFVPDLDYFAAAVLPLMRQAGLRHPLPVTGEPGRLHGIGCAI